MRFLVSMVKSSFEVIIYQFSIKYDLFSKPFVCISRILSKKWTMRGLDYLDYRILAVILIAVTTSAEPGNSRYCSLKS